MTTSVKKPAVIVGHQGHLTCQRRWRLTDQHGATVWLTGLPAAGKSTIAYAVEERLVVTGRVAYVLDGDNLRHGLNRDLGFDPAARTENVRRVAEVATLFCQAGAVSLVSLVSPYRADRARARALHAATGLAFIEVHVATRLEECERRDPKGLYCRARRGEIEGLTGVDAPYEPPTHPELIVGFRGESVADAVDRVLGALPGCLP